MSSQQKKIYHGLFATTIVALLVFKWGDLHLPFFWDELGVYSRAAHHQFINGISLLPSSLPPELSRGHPLLFTFMNALAWRVFGEHVFAAHLFCFSISVLLLLAIYVKVSKYFDSLTAIISVIVLSVQPLFLAQSAMVLPEIMLALLVFLAICSYYENKFLLFAVFASMAILTKEAAIVIPLIALTYSVKRAVLMRRLLPSLKFGALLLTIVPYVIFGLFLVIQKQQNGWYFFPLHIDHVGFSVDVFVQQIQSFTSFLFWGQGRNLSTIVCIVGAIVAMLLGKYRLVSVGRSFTLLLLITGLAFLGFNSITDLYMERYVIVVMVCFSIFTASALTTVSKNRLVAAGFVIALVIISSQNLEGNVFHYDADLGYRHEVNVNQQAVNYVVKIQKPGDEVMGNFPIGFSLNFSAGGYLGEGDVRYKRDDDNSYYLLIADPGTDYHPEGPSDERILIKNFDDHFAHVQVYWVRKKKVEQL